MTTATLKTSHKTSMVRARIDPELKSEAESILKELGVTATQAITMLYKQIRIQKGIPFDVKIPNAETRQAMEELERGEGVVCSGEEYLQELEELRKQRARRQEG